MPLNINSTNQPHCSAGAVVGGNKVSNTTKIASGALSTVGVICAFPFIAKRRGIDIDFLSLGSQIKTIGKTFKNHECDEIDALLMASGSIAGGYGAGILTDNKNSKAKEKEVFAQAIGNYIIPTIVFGAGIKSFKIIQNQFNIQLSKIAKILSGFAFLISGVVIGNKVTNKLKSKVYNEPEEKVKIKWQDWGSQVDNACLVTSLSISGTEIAKNASKIIPIANILPGYVIGTKQS